MKASAAPPWVFMLLIAPFGASGGFLTVALGWHLGAQGVPDEAIAGVVAASYLPHTWKFLWAPLVDLSWSARRWYALATALLAASMLLMAQAGADGTQLALLTAVVLASNVAATFSGIAVESLMAHAAADDAKGRAGGWFQAGNLGGQGLGGGLALWLMQGPGLTPMQAGGVLAGLFVLGAVPLAWVPRVRPAPRVAAPLRALWADLWALVRARGGWLAAAVCFLPIGSGAAANLWPAVAGDWHAGADTVAFINGTAGGLLSAAGCLAGGWLCDRMDRKAAYCLFGALMAALALAMAAAPRTEAAFIGFAGAYAVVQGLSYAAFSAVVLEAIGRGAAATKYNLLASLSNMPIAYGTLVDGWAHTAHGPTGLLQADAALGAAGLAVFGALVLATRPRTRAQPA